VWDILSESRIAADFTDFADFKSFLVKGVAHRGGSSCFSIDGAVGNADRIWASTPQNRTYLVGDLMKAGQGWATSPAAGMGC